MKNLYLGARLADGCKIAVTLNDQRSKRVIAWFKYPYCYSTVPPSRTNLQNSGTTEFGSP